MKFLIIENKRQPDDTKCYGAGKFFPKDGVAKLISHQITPTKVCHSEKLKKIYKKLNYY